jgi:hypothetical protein
MDTPCEAFFNLNFEKVPKTALLRQKKIIIKWIHAYKSPKP